MQSQWWSLHKDVQASHFCIAPLMYYGSILRIHLQDQTWCHEDDPCSGPSYRLARRTKRQSSVKLAFNVTRPFFQLISNEQNLDREKAAKVSSNTALCVNDRKAQSWLLFATRIKKQYAFLLDTVKQFVLWSYRLLAIEECNEVWGLS